jgi:hypothetical protein
MSGYRTAYNFAFAGVGFTAIYNAPPTQTARHVRAGHRVGSRPALYVAAHPRGVRLAHYDPRLI